MAHRAAVQNSLLTLLRHGLKIQTLKTDIKRIKYEKEYMYMCVKHFTVQQKLTL